MSTTFKQKRLMDLLRSNINKRSNVPQKHRGTYDNVKKNYYNADPPNLIYGGNSYSIQVNQPSGSRMISIVGWH